MTSEQEAKERELKTLRQEARLAIVEVARSKPMVEHAEEYLLPYIEAHRDPNHEDEIRISGRSWQTLPEWLRDQLRGPWAFLTEQHQQAQTKTTTRDDCPSFEDCRDRSLTPEEQSALHRRVINILEGRHT